MSKLLNDYLNTIQEDITNLDEFVITPTIILLHAVYKRYLSKAAKVCRGSESSLERKLCVVTYKMLGRKAQLAKIKQSIGSCDKEKDPKKCRDQILSKSKKISTDMDKLVNQFKKIKFKGIK